MGGLATKHLCPYVYPYMCESVMFWVGQNRWYAPYMTVYLVIPVPKITVCTPYICRVGQNHIYTVCIRYLWQGNHQIYGHKQCIYTVLANPIYMWFWPTLEMLLLAYIINKHSTHVNCQRALWIVNEQCKSSTSNVNCQRAMWVVNKQCESSTSTAHSKLFARTHQSQVPCQRSLP